MSSIDGMLIPDAILAAGFVYRQAVQVPARLLVVFGIWLHFFPGLLLSVLVVFGLLSGASRGVPELLSLWSALAGGVICGSMLYRVTGNYLKLHSKRVREA